MIPAIVLCAMAVVDGALAGFRAFAGRDAHIDKRAPARRWIIRGTMVGAAELALIAAMLLGMLARADDRALLFDEMVAAGTRMLLVFVPYAVAVLAALLAYAVPRLDIRCLAISMVLGPLTMARIAFLLAGAGAAAWTAPAEVQVAAFATVTVVVAGEVVLNRWAAGAVPDVGPRSSPPSASTSAHRR